MDITEYMVELAKTLSLDIAQDVYRGANQSYLTFTYEDEHGVLFGDNEILADIVYFQLHLLTPTNLNYMSIKRAIKSWLESNAFFITSIQTFEDTDVDKKHTVFTCQFSKERE